jgi:hypothetical protein
LRARQARRAGIDVFALPPSAHWSERRLRYRTAPRGGRRVGRLSRVRRGRFSVALDVSRLPAAGKRLDLAIVARRCSRSRCPHPLVLASREAGARGPRLLLGVASNAVATVAAAGDIACAPGKPVANWQCQQQATSDLLVGQGYDGVLALGDNQYDAGTLQNYLGSYDPTWGRVRGITRPVPGNHEYSASYPPPASATADGYFDYFNGVGAAKGRAGRRGDGWYSFDLGAWHLVALNSNCAQVRKGVAANGCAVGSPQETWLRADLAAHANVCTLAYWHYPRFSSGNAADSDHPEVAPLWDDLVAAGTDLLLAGHQHGYERFAPNAGLREIVIGSGGEDFHGFGPPDPGSEVINADTFGVLRLSLRPTSYDWRFVPIAGQTFTDAGTEACH